MNKSRKVLVPVLSMSLILTGISASFLATSATAAPKYKVTYIPKNLGNPYFDAIVGGLFPGEEDGPLGPGTPIHWSHPQSPAHPGSGHWQAGSHRNQPRHWRRFDQLRRRGIGPAQGRASQGP